MESGINKKPNILIITSFLSNDNSSQMIWDVTKSLENDYYVDILSKYPLKKEFFNVYSVCYNYEKFIHRCFNFLKIKFKSFIKKITNNIEKKTLPYYFFGINQENPPVNPKRIVNKIEKEYDFILVFFWQGLLNATTLYEIYKKTKKPLLLIAADMFPMTGGCSYFWDCDRLQNSCGKCPGISSNDENDTTRKNFLFKKEVLSNLNCVFLGNSWQLKHAAKSGIFKNMEKIYPIIDENVFKQRDKLLLKKKFNYSDKIVLFFGAIGINDPRKGFTYLLNALKFISELRTDLIENMVLLVAGSGEKVEGLDKFEVKYTGHLTFDQLAEHYALSDVFLSPSIQDAGPMMLNQALMCGTPAVAFNIGTACDIINDKTGYLAKYKDSKDFCNGIIQIITKSDIELQEMSEICRTQSLERSSYKGFRNGILTSYNKIKSN
jgi:glycosyltransferase involved in cell wall biosynthesis